MISSIVVPTRILHPAALIAILLLFFMTASGEASNSPPYFVNCPETYIAAECTLQVAYDFDAEDGDSGSVIHYSLGPGTGGSIDAQTGSWEWGHGGATGLHNLSIIATDELGESAACHFEVFVNSAAPYFIGCGGDSSSVTSVIGEIVHGSVQTVDPDNCPEPLAYSLISFGGPGLFEIDPVAGEWSWRTHPTDDFLGDFDVTIGVTDGFNSETCTFTITVLPTFDIWIGTDLMHPQGQYANIPIYVSDESDYLAGFDFLITYDGTFLNFLDAEIGEGLGPEGCGWEYFTYRYVNQSECDGWCPVHMLRFVAMAEADLQPPYPLCFGGDSLELVNMRFLVSGSADFHCKYTPVSFYWIDCGDNGVSSVSGDTLWISSMVYLFDATTTPTYIEVTGADGYGGHSGIPDVDCLEGSVHGSRPVEGVIYKGGGLKTECVVDVVLYGDLNLNRIPNEISDLVLYLNYFIFGLPVFVINPDIQIETSDVNEDGRVLTAGDIVYMVRIIMGDITPLLKPDQGDGEMYIECRPRDETLAVSIRSDVDVGALFLEIDIGSNDAFPVLLADRMDMKWNLEEGRLRVMIYSMSTARIPAGETELLLLEGAETPTIMQVSASDYYGNTIQTELGACARGESLRLIANRPNPFNPTTEICFYTPASAEWSIEIFNIIGQKVDELHGTCGTGLNSVLWNAGSHPSGVYLYRVMVGEQSANGKMVLMK